MDEYNLVPGELVVLQADSVYLGAGKDREKLDEIVLTNMNLILVATVSEGLFSRRKYLKRCPLDSVVCHGDVPQAVSTRANGVPVLRVAFADESLAISFEEGSKRLADRWAESIRRAVAGNIDAIDTSELPSGTAGELVDMVDGAMSVVGAVGSMLASPKKKSKVADKERMASKVSGKCPGCHAPATGRHGQSVICPYCDTKYII